MDFPRAEGPEADGNGDIFLGPSGVAEMVHSLRSGGVGAAGAD